MQTLLPHRQRCRQTLRPRLGGRLRVAERGLAELRQTERGAELLERVVGEHAESTELESVVEQLFWGLRSAVQQPDHLELGSGSLRQRSLAAACDREHMHRLAADAAAAAAARAAAAGLAHRHPRILRAAGTGRPGAGRHCSNAQ